MRFVQFTAADGVLLDGTLYEAPGDQAIVVAGAMGAPRRYYERFAEYAAARGFTTLVFDYRGLDSPRKSQARLHEWGEFDIAAALQFMSGRSIALVTHSVGGQVAGLAPNLTTATRIVMVASQSGYWRNWSGIRRHGLHLLWLVMPVLARLLGFFPGRILGLGTGELPRGVAIQWSSWGKHPRYLFGFGSELDLEEYRHYSGPMLAISLEGDHYAPRAAVDALVREYPNAKVTRRHIEDPSVGHFGVFRPGAGMGVWEGIIDWIR
jgi:predicted alpha/beta hydrolase